VYYIIVICRRIRSSRENTQFYSRKTAREVRLGFLRGGGWIDNNLISTTIKNVTAFIGS